MTVDLTPLEQAAARVGLAGLKARVVPHDRRRGWWFRWGRGELLVSDRVIDRCPPADASALLMHEVMRRRRVGVSQRRSLAIVTIYIVTTLWLIIAHGSGSTEHEATPWFVRPTVLMLPAGFLVLLMVAVGLVRTAFAEWADDQTVKLLGDATPLVRGLNEMDFEEIHLGRKILPARPDLHRRAERLVRLHGLCEAQPPA